MSNLQKFLAIAIFSCFIITLCFLCILSLVITTDSDFSKNQGLSDFNTFWSCQQLANTLNHNIDKSHYLYPYLLEDGVFFDVAEPAPEASGQNFGSRSDDRYSVTNVQVEGIDEADIIKTDGEYIYLLAQNKLNIVGASNGNLEASKVFDIEGSPIAMYINDNILSVVSSNIVYPVFYESSDFDSRFWQSTLANRVYMFDISNKSDIELERRVEISGYYSNSRMFNNTIYIVSNHGINLYDRVTAEEASKLLPLVIDSLGDSASTIETACNNVYAMNEKSKNFINVVAIPLDSVDSSVKSNVILGDASGIYMSYENLYLTSSQYDYNSCSTFNKAMGLCDGFNNESTYSTEIYKLAVEGTRINFVSSGSVPGTILNQFSMDEFEENFRIVTTQNISNRWTSEIFNSLYVLNSNLEITGKVLNIAKGERIYSVRFMGEKAYVVTFKAVDPLFVFDLSEPSKPKITGELKLPGFSDYLHPISENLLLGVGKEATKISSDWALQRGLKVGLFNVSDPNNPELIDFTIIGDRGSSSAVSYDHRAFLYDEQNSLVIMPADIYIVDNSNKIRDVEDKILSQGFSRDEFKIRLVSGYLEVYTKDSVSPERVSSLYSFLKEDLGFSEFTLITEENIFDSQSYAHLIRGLENEFDQYTYGESSAYGFMVYAVTASGISEKAQLLKEREDDYGNYYYGTYSPRSLYIGDYLYTWAGDAKIESFTLSDFSKIAEVEIDMGYSY